MRATRRRNRGTASSPDYTAVLRSSWARTVIVLAFFEFALMFGAFTYVGADLHLRFGLNFSLVGLFVGAFAIGGLIYSLSVGRLMARIGQIGLPAVGGALLAAAYVTLAFEPVVWLAPLAIAAIGLGFYMLHNTMQTNATQMTPEARGTAVAIFSSALYMGQTAGVAAGGFIFDRFTAVPVFLTAAVLLLAHGFLFSQALRKRAAKS
jgi:predicted MFS family arabinose efflux permease